MSILLTHFKPLVEASKWSSRRAEASRRPEARVNKPRLVVV
jgi:hypothetical protein